MSRAVCGKVRESGHMVGSRAGVAAGISLRDKELFVQRNILKANPLRDLNLTSGCVG